MLQRWTWNLQKLCGALTIALVGLTALNLVLIEIRKQQALSKASNAFGSTPPEQVIARLDGMTDSTQIQSYAALLDELDSLCPENRAQVAILALSLKRDHHKAGVEITGLEALESLAAMAVGKLDEADCMQVYSDARQVL